MMNPRTAVAAVLLVVLHAIAPRPGIVRLVDGQPDGVEILWYEDGRPESLRVYRNGHKVGRHYGWWPDGTPRFDAGYRDDAFEGEYLNGTFPFDIDRLIEDIATLRRSRPPAAVS